MDIGQSSSTNKKRKNLYSFFSKVDKPKDGSVEQAPISSPIEPPLVILPSVTSSPLNNDISSLDFNLESHASIERDPGKRKRMCEHPVNERDRIRRAYLRLGPYQPKLLEYPRTQCGKQNRRFQEHWYEKFRWLEYSLTTDKSYCFHCFLFLDNNTPSHLSTLATIGFNSWKRINQRDKCAFLTHIGFSPSSYHNMCVRNAVVLMKPTHHINEVMNVVSQEERRKCRLRVRTSIEAAQWLALQGCPFRGRDESSSSLNRGNFIELVDAYGKKNQEIGNVVLDNAPRHATYTSPDIQKELLNIMGNKVRDMVREELGCEPYCILVDEAQDASKREQMCVILRFVDKMGYLRERFLAIKSVSDTTSLNLKNQISGILVHHNLQVQKMRGQGYDGASNMRGALNGLQALFIRDCPYAYYVHCFAHRLQLTLVSAAKDVRDIWQFFSHLECIVNYITSSPKRIGELKDAHKMEIEHLLESGDRYSGSGANQITNLHRHGATRWSSHYESVKSLLTMYVATCTVFESLIENSPSPTTRAEIGGAYTNMISFEFVFVLHLMNKIFSITDVLCQALQRKSQDILTAMRFVHTTKMLLQALRDDGWEELLQEVTTFCAKSDISIPDFTGAYKKVATRSRNREYPTVDHHYHFDVFNPAIDFLMVELDTRFNDRAVELLSLSSALDPRNSFESFNIDDICKLAEKFYPQDFTPQDISCLKFELQHYKNDVVLEPQFQVATLPDLCHKLIASGRSENYVVFTRLIRLVLTLPVSTATTERAFSAMKHVKTEIRNKMNDDFLDDCMTLYIEREYTRNLDIESIIDEFYALGKRRGPF
ncbi:hypothetical protein OROGR_032079 [Orobanche gracilis]